MRGRFLQADEPLGTFMDYCTYGFMIDNIVLIVTGTLHERNVQVLHQNPKLLNVSISFNKQPDKTKQHVPSLPGRHILNRSSAPQVLASKATSIAVPKHPVAILFPASPCSTFRMHHQEQ